MGPALHRPWRIEARDNGNNESVLADAILEQTDDTSHFVQLYEADETVLTRNVGKYLADGLAKGGGVAVISIAAHKASFGAELERRGLNQERLERNGRLTWLDADDTLAQFLVDGYPDADRFDRAVGVVVRDAVVRAGAGGLRAYGEMVGLLWSRRQFPAAIRLEQLWNRLRTEVPFGLFCGYPIDVFGAQFDAPIVDALLCAHTHLLPSGANGRLDAAVNRAMSEVFGSENTWGVPPGRRGKIWASLPSAESAILWLRANEPEKADAVMTLAREYYQAN